jgi:Tol biopolymer transport system component
MGAGRSGASRRGHWRGVGIGSRGVAPVWLALALAVSAPGALHAQLPMARTEAEQERQFPERIIPSGDLVRGFGPTLTPDGQTLLYVARRNPETILLSRWNGEGWDPPVVAPFSGRWPDQEPFVSPDGTRVYFASRRPVDDQGEENPEYDIWVVDRLGDDTFGTPRRLGPEVNTAAYENYPAVTADGTLFFSRRTPDAGTDLYQAAPDGDGFHVATPLEELNSWGSDADPWVDPDGRRLIFSSVRSDGAGQGDLYVSYLCREGWTTPWNLGPAVNTEAYEYTPTVSPDGVWLLFSRDRWDVWRIPTAQVEIQSPCPAGVDEPRVEGAPPER